MLRIRFEQAGVIEPMQAAQVASFMNTWRDTFARIEDRAGTAGLFPLAALRFSVARVDFAGESCRSPMAAFWKPNSKLLTTRQRSFMTVSIVPDAVIHRFDSNDRNAARAADRQWPLSGS
jgi:hypothetical protein